MLGLEHVRDGGSVLVRRPSTSSCANDTETGEGESVLELKLSVVKQDQNRQHTMDKKEKKRAERK